MKRAYEKELNNLQDWIKHINSQLSFSGQAIGQGAIMAQVQADIQVIADSIRHEYPFYSRMLFEIKNRIIVFNPAYNSCAVNPAVFGELYVIILHISEEPINTRIWGDIHPDIVYVAKDLYCDGYFASAAEAAIKEVESKMRKLFKEYKPEANVPKDVDNVIDALLSENGCHQFCDIDEKNGQNYRKGIHQMFKGAFFAYRHPNMHGNFPCTQQESFERITLASQMMYVLTKREVHL